MIVLIGGAFQGKLAYAKARFSLTPADIFYCRADSPELDLTKRAVSGLHLALLAQVRGGGDCAAWLERQLPDLGQTILLCDDISAGIVPADPQLRLWREETSRALARLCREADEVVRLFCGLPTRLK